MTEQEAELLVQKLTRIWEPVEAQMPVNTPDSWLFYAIIRQDVSLIVQSPGEFSLDFTSEDAVEWELGSLRASGEGIIKFHPFYEQDKELATRYAVQWMPFFRRGCWLSGCDIEASAHEKAEWLQGFTREELEAWRLHL